MRPNYGSNQTPRVGVLDDPACPDGRVGPPINNGGTATPLCFTLTSIRGSVWGHAHGLVDEGGEPELGVRRPISRPVTPSGIATYGRRRSANPPLSPCVSGRSRVLPAAAVTGRGPGAEPTSDALRHRQVTLRGNRTLPRRSRLRERVRRDTGRRRSHYQNRCDRDPLRPTLHEVLPRSRPEYRTPTVGPAEFAVKDARCAGQSW